VVVQEVRGGKGVTVRAGYYIYFMEKEKKIMNWEEDFIQHTIVSAVMRVEFVSNRMSYIVLRGRWCNVIVVNVHAPSEEKSDDSGNSFMRN